MSAKASKKVRSASPTSDDTSGREFSPARPPTAPELEQIPAARPRTASAGEKSRRLDRRRRRKQRNPAGSASDGVGSREIPPARPPTASEAEKSRRLGLRRRRKQRNPAGSTADGVGSREIPPARPPTASEAEKSRRLLQHSPELSIVCSPNMSQRGGLSRRRWWAS
jgi:hypothetical protein